MDEEDIEDELPLNAQLAGLRSSLTELTDPSTTPEAASYARQILGSRSARTNAREKEIGRALDETTKAAREALQKARQRLLEKPAYDQSLKWLRLAAAFGSPTRTGHFGESLGMANSSLAESRAEQLEAEREREKELTQYDTGLASLEERQLAQELQELQYRRLSDTKLDTEALRVLSKRGSSATGVGSKPMGEFGKRAVDLLGERAYNRAGGYSQEYHALVTKLENDDKKRRDASSGIDVADEGEALDTEAAANELGLPVLLLDPLRGLSTKQKTARMGRLDAEAKARLAQLDEETAGAPETITKVKQFITANKETATGGAMRVARAVENIPGIGETLKGGIEAITSIADDDAQLMDSIAKELTPKMRTPGSGASSNLDVQMFAGATLGRHNSFEVNQNIANAMIAQNQRLLEYKQFLRDYRQLYGHLEGSDSSWKDYLEANPIFDPNLGRKNRVFQLNKDRQPYREWFQQKNQKNDPSLEGLTNEEIEWAKKPAMAEGGKVAMLTKRLTKTPRSGMKLSEGLKIPEGYSRFETEGGRVIGVRPDGTRVRVFSTTKEAAPHFAAAMNNGGWHKEKIRRVPLSELWSKDGDDYAEGGQVEEDEDANDESALAALGQSLMQGATGQLGDELGAIDRGEYRESLKENPGITTIGEVGGAASIIEFGKQVLLRSGITPAALKGIPQAKLIEVGRMALLGAGVGGVSGVGGGQDDDRLSSGLQSAVLAGISAPLTGLATKYGYLAAAGLGDRLTGKPISSPEKRILEALEADQMTPRDLTDQVRTARKNRVPMNLGEAGGRELTALSRAAAGYGRGEAQQLADETLTRQGGARERVGEQVNRALAPSEYFATEDKLIKELYTNADPFYKAAYQKHPSVKSAALLRILDTPSGKKAAREAAKSIRDKPGAKLGKIDAVGMIRQPSLEFADQIKQEFDDMIKHEEAQGPTGKGRRLRALRNALRKELDTIAPEYKAARAQYAGDLEIRDALRTGRDEFIKQTPEEIRRAVAGMNFSEMDAFRSGAAQKLFEMINNPANEGNFAKKLIGSPALTEKLELIAQGKPQAKVLVAALEKEAELYEARKKLLSKAESGATKRAIEGLSSPRLVLEQALDIIRSQPVLREKTADAIAARLRGVTEAELKAFEDGLTKKSQKLAVRSRRAGKAGMIGAIAAGALAAPEPKPKESDHVGE